LATKALLGTAGDLAFDRAGNLLIADTGLGAGACADVTSIRSPVREPMPVRRAMAPRPPGLGSGPGLPRRSRIGLETSPWRAQDEGFDPEEPTVAEPYVRVVAEATGTFYGQKMKAGDIYQVAGEWSTKAGPYRNAVLGTKTALWSASDALADSSGNLVIDRRHDRQTGPQSKSE
jgi:hypothetical protein